MELDIRTIRELSGLNQTEFWSRVGVTQSGGSRYEAGRRLPKPVQHLLRLTYIDKIDLSKVKREDMALIAYLKLERRPLYKQLRRSSDAWMRQRR